ncbi:MarR family winged helix-turn-helix transcriptional regulator [Agromyces sp. NPDC004153]
MTTDQINPDQPDRSEEEPTAASAGSDRPFGFWLKLVDRRLAEEMETLFAADGITRRDWRLLNLLAGTATDERLAERLRAKPHALHHLAERGWVEGAPPLLTDAGREALARLEEQVRTLRERIAGAVPAEDFATTLRTLEAVARELGWDESQPMPRGARGGRRHGWGHRHGFGRRFGAPHGFDPEARGFGHPGFGPRAGFGGHPGHAGHAGHSGHAGHQDVHVHVHVHDDRKGTGKGHGRGHHGRPHPEA